MLSSLCSVEVLELILLLINHLLHVSRNDTQTYLLWIHLNQLLIEELAVLYLWHVKWLQLLLQQLVDVEALEERVGQHFLKTILAESLGLLLYQ